MVIVHCAGAEIINDFAFAEDDPNYTALGRRPNLKTFHIHLDIKLQVH